LKNAWNSKLGVFQDRDYIFYSSDIGILVNVYPEFLNRNIEDIPYEEYRSAMDGALKYVLIKIQIQIQVE
jgi:hypothetical protein